LTCKSSIGRLFKIAKNDLIPRLKEKQDSWEIFWANALNKEIKFLKNVCIKEKFHENFQKLTEKIIINKHLIEEFLSLEDNTNIGLKPPKKLVENILKWIGNTSQNQKKTNDLIYYSYPTQNKKLVSYNDLREKKKPVIIIKNK